MLFSYLFPPLRLSLGLAGDLGWGVARPKNSNDLNKNDLDLGWGVARPSNSNLNKNDLDLSYRSIGKRSETLFLVFMNGRLVTSILGINHCWVLPGQFLL